MPADWRRLARETRMPVIDHRIKVVLGQERRQIVAIDERADRLRVWSVVARAGWVDEEVQRRAWMRNRLSEFVGFRVDRRGRLIGETYVPDGATPDEWTYLIRNLAAACDHVEYLLTGRDSE